jgi:hypothetical protein
MTNLFQILQTENLLLCTLPCEKYVEIHLQVRKILKANNTRIICALRERLCVLVGCLPHPNPLLQGEGTHLILTLSYKERELISP